MPIVPQKASGVGLEPTPDAFCESINSAYQKAVPTAGQGQADPIHQCDLQQGQPATSHHPQPEVLPALGLVLTLEGHDQQRTDDHRQREEGVLERMEPGALHVDVPRRELLQQE